MVSCETPDTSSLLCAVILYLEFKNRKIKAGTWYTDDGKGRAWGTQVWHFCGLNMC